MAVADLLTVRTRAQIEASITSTLSGAGFPTTSWQSGAVPRTLIRASSTVLEHLYGLVGSVGAAAFLSSSSGAWLTLHAASRFDVTRSPSTFAEHALTLVNATPNPRTITPGQLLVTTAGGRRFRSTNTANLVVPGLSTAPVTVRCEVAGSIGNTAPTVLVTPAYAGLSFSYGSLSLSGEDEESDAALRARCLAKWSTLGRGANLDAYVYMATTAPTAPTITRASVVPGAGDGTLSVYIAQSSSAASGGQVSAVQAYIDARCPVTDAPTVLAAGVVTVAVTASVEFESSTYNTTDAHTAIEDALTAAINGQPMGRDIDLGALYAAVRGAAAGVLDVDITVPSADTAVSVSQISVAGTLAITYSP